ncbi:type VI secretion system amidase immunity protein Tai4 [Enterobacteriaceae bacterium H20N1]|uniref:Type VI secretion system amidase immunity protein Tai4 n=1 Tax=Dryocola boscaweniae TaxID=2925397 RepID=A0A9X2W5K0_9ENTR|nr:T6SS amidase immunity protein Tai4 family protein [Dryocola boscaweniae]MCT4700602.1 type VI secretion system amidase immunity protein Tai4 [Dryocola boscaweniae]MCT4717794.1 type VI secretion system amidase immunity protein Tai4 [Dryocola boscaweniae]
MDVKVALMISLLAFPALAKESNNNSQNYNLENFALSMCLAKGFSDNEVKKDAFSAVNAYVELGSYPAEAYEEADNLIKEFLAKKYVGKNRNSEFIVMKCIDASRSKELKKIEQKYAY